MRGEQMLRRVASGEKLADQLQAEPTVCASHQHRPRKRHEPADKTNRLRPLKTYKDLEKVLVVLFPRSWKWSDLGSLASLYPFPPSQVAHGGRTCAKTVCFGKHDRCRGKTSKPPLSPRVSLSSRLCRQTLSSSGGFRHSQEILGQRRSRSKASRLVDPIAKKVGGMQKHAGEVSSQGFEAQSRVGHGRRLLIHVYRFAVHRCRLPPRSLDYNVLLTWRRPAFSQNTGARLETVLQLQVGRLLPKLSSVRGKITSDRIQWQVQVTGSYFSLMLLIYLVTQWGLHWLTPQTQLFFNYWKFQLFTLNFKFATGS